MFTNQESAIRLFAIQEKYTSATLSAFTDKLLNTTPAPGFRTVAELAAHCMIVRESSLATILADDSLLEDLKVCFPDGEKVSRITLDDLLKIRRERFKAFCDGLKRIDWALLDSPFKTCFDNYSTPRNYLMLILQEEIHHRGQMTLICRLFGLTPPFPPYKELAELAVPQAPD